MKNGIEAMITDITATTAEAEDYTGEDGLLYCGKCHTPKEAYFAEGKTCFGRDRHPAECDCQRAAREKQQAAESRQKHLEKVEDLKRRGFTDPAMRNWTFEHDNGRNPQTETARFYVESWETMQAENIGYLFWGGVGTGKSYLAACIANALMEKEVAVCMTNFATILGDLAASFEGRNEYISRLCSYPLLILDDFGMERGTEYGLEQVYSVIDSRYRSGKPLIATTNLTLEELQHPQRSLYVIRSQVEFPTFTCRRKKDHSSRRFLLILGMGALLSAVSAGVAVSAVILYHLGIIFGFFLPYKPVKKSFGICG
jgi:DNA replication protein DnaC